MNDQMICTVFDNGGRTLDRYTLIYENGNVYDLSHNPCGTQGVANYAGDTAYLRSMTPDQFIADARKDTKWLGKEVTDHTKLPKDVQRFITEHAAVDPEADEFWEDLDNDNRITLTMSSDEYGTEHFAYDTYDEAYEASMRLMKKCRELNDGIERTFTIN